MSTLCPVQTLEGIAIVATHFGLALALFGLFFSEPGLYAIKNKLVFSCLTLGTVFSSIPYFSVLIYSHVYGSVVVNSRGTYGYSNTVQGYLFFQWVIVDFCLYIILMERLLPLFINFYRSMSQPSQYAIKITVALLLDIPRIVLATIMAREWPNISPANVPTIRILHTATPLITLSANAILTGLFIHTLLKNRGTEKITEMILKNKSQWTQIIFSGLIGLVLIILRIISYYTPSNVNFQLFTNVFYAIVLLSTFRSYVIVSRGITQQIFATNVNVTTKTSSGKDNVNGTKLELGKSTKSGS
ncbi:hypothetical protein BKA69DRAFT_1035963 [Paraphysoderma sedebokerense]|nr:hypothetical protein BKA69DRAFT_1035963 [Paraphysoderma sedebokerense]